MTPTDYHEVDARENPELAVAMAQKFLAEAAAPAPVPTTDAPMPRLARSAGTTVTLPGGVAHKDGTLDKEAEVRELTGSDEEVLARTNSLSKMVTVLLERGVVTVGDEQPSKDLFARMLAGDLEALLLGIRVATFGPLVEYPEVTCPHCSAVSEISVDLTTDVPTGHLSDPDDREFTLDLPSGKTALVALPDGNTQQALFNSKERTLAALNTLLLSKCVLEIDELPVLGSETVRNLGIRDRNLLRDEINKRNPGPRLSEVSKSCPECSENIALPLGLTDLFLL